MLVILMKIILEKLKILSNLQPDDDALDEQDLLDKALE